MRTRFRLLAIALLLFLSACPKPPETTTEPVTSQSSASRTDRAKRDLAGRWNTKTGFNDYEFLSDGTLLYYKKGTDSVEYRKTYKVMDEDRLLIESPGSSQVVKMRLIALIGDLDLEWERGTESLEKAK